MALFDAFQEDYSFTSAAFCEHVTPTPGPVVIHLMLNFSEHWTPELILIIDAEVLLCLLAR